MPIRLYYLGPPGSFGEQAALKFLANSGWDAELVPLSSHSSVVASVDAGELDAGIAAIENSLEGAVNETIDAILSSHSVAICGEIILSIEQHLIAARGTRLEDIQVVMSHTQALAQCRGFLENHLPGVPVEAALSTSAAVEQAVKRAGAAAIGNRRAAELHQGAILAESIQDVANNKTRFLVLARHDAAPSGDDKTSLAFTVENRPGALVSAMRHLSDRNLNLTRVESRPSREDLGIYIFLIDFQGHRSDPDAREALAAMKRDGVMFLPHGEPLGSYPRFAS